MSEENRHTLRYQILRYTPNLVRDEWVNIGVLLEEVPLEQRTAALPSPRRAVRLIEEPSEIARVRRLHPAADESLLRALAAEFDARIRAPEPEAATYLAKLGETLSNVLQFSPQKAVLAEDFDAELERLFRDHVAPPATVRSGIVENTRAWIRARLNDVFRRHHILAKLERSVRVEEFTQPGDPLRLDYAYRCNGTRGYLHAVALGRDPAQAKVLAYTAECIRARASNSEIAAITEIEPARENPRHQFIARLFAEQQISIVPLTRIEKFAENLRPRLH
ncbi:MAG TPA: DUF3037 domain-containing protein [Candidatus Polarisedimenticolia bacterium]|nr:DUF3037 domain-containing protein [Candidatus Polarisedimenticolia bacterium]